MPDMLSLCGQNMPPKGGIKLHKKLLSDELEKKKDPCLIDTDSEGNTPLMLAVKNRYTYAIKLIRKALIRSPYEYIMDAVNNEGYTPLMLAAKGGDADTIDALCCLTKHKAPRPIDLSKRHSETDPRMSEDFASEEMKKRIRAYRLWRFIEEGDFLSAKSLVQEGSFDINLKRRNKTFWEYLFSNPRNMHVKDQIALAREIISLEEMDINSFYNMFFSRTELTPMAIYGHRFFQRKDFFANLYEAKIVKDIDCLGLSNDKISEKLKCALEFSVREGGDLSLDAVLDSMIGSILEGENKGFITDFVPYLLTYGGVEKHTIANNIRRLSDAGHQDIYTHLEQYSKALNFRDEFINTRGKNVCEGDLLNLFNFCLISEDFITSLDKDKKQGVLLEAIISTTSSCEIGEIGEIGEIAARCIANHYNMCRSGQLIPILYDALKDSLESLGEPKKKQFEEFLLSTVRHLSKGPIYHNSSPYIGLLHIYKYFRPCKAIDIDEYNEAALIKLLTFSKGIIMDDRSGSVPFDIALSFLEEKEKTLLEELANGVTPIYTDMGGNVGSLITFYISAANEKDSSKCKFYERFIRKIFESHKVVFFEYMKKYGYVNKSVDTPVDPSVDPSEISRARETFKISGHLKDFFDSCTFPHLQPIAFLTLEFLIKENGIDELQDFCGEDGFLTCDGVGNYIINKDICDESDLRFGFVEIIEKYILESLPEQPTSRDLFGLGIFFPKSVFSGAVGPGAVGPDADGPDAVGPDDDYKPCCKKPRNSQTQPKEDEELPTGFMCSSIS